MLTHFLFISTQVLSPMINDEEPPVDKRRIHMRCEYKYLDSRDKDNYCSEKFLQGTLAVGELCLLRPQQVNPTQTSVGKGMSAAINVSGTCHTACKSS